MSYEGLEPVALSMSQDVIMSFMSYEGLEPVALSMSQGTPDGFTDPGNVIIVHGPNPGTGPQSSEGSNPILGEISPDLSGGACFSSDSEITNPHDGILSLQAPDLATVPEMVHHKGCWSEATRHFRDHPDFAALLNFMNSLEPEIVEDEDFLDFYTLSSFMDILRQKKTDKEDVAYDMVNVLLNADAAVSE